LRDSIALRDGRERLAVVREPRLWLVVQFDAHVASVAVALAVQIGVVDLQRGDAADGQQRRAVGTDPEVEVPAGAIGARYLRDARSGGAR